MYWEGFFSYQNKTYWATAQYIIEADSLPELLEYEIYDYKDHEVSELEPGMVTCLEYKIADALDHTDF